MFGFSAVVLAGGKGTRMGGSVPKVLLELCQKPLICWSLELVKALGIKEIIVVTGYKASWVERVIVEHGVKVKFVRQKKPLGTAHSVRLALPFVSNQNLLVLFGDDSALYKLRTIKDFLKAHRNNKNVATFLTVRQKSTSDIGGLERGSAGQLIGVLRKEDVMAKKMERVEVLCGAFCFNSDWIGRMIPLIPKTVSSGEYPLPGIIKIAASKGYFINTFLLKDTNQWNSINTPAEMWEAERKRRNR